MYLSETQAIQLEMNNQTLKRNLMVTLYGGAPIINPEPVLATDKDEADYWNQLADEVCGGQNALA